jgi:hypothetical protein
MAVRLVNSGSKVMRFRAGPVRPGETIAWFFRGAAPGPEVQLVTEPKHEAVWLAPEELVSADLSLWHRVAIEADIKGLSIANVER